MWENTEGFALTANKYIKIMISNLNWLIEKIIKALRKCLMNLNKIMY